MMDATAVVQAVDYRRPADRGPQSALLDVRSRLKNKVTGNIVLVLKAYAETMTARTTRYLILLQALPRLFR